MTAASTAKQTFAHGDLIRIPTGRVATVNRTHYAGDENLRVECTDGTSWIAAACQPAIDTQAKESRIAMERAPWERPQPVPVTEGMNGTGIRRGEKIMADYSTYRDGVETLRTVVMRVRSAWPLQEGLTYVSDLDGDENGDGRIYAVRTETIRVIA